MRMEERHDLGPQGILPTEVMDCVCHLHSTIGQFAETKNSEVEEKNSVYLVKRAAANTNI
jgi:hypothetical protein